MFLRKSNITSIKFIRSSFVSFSANKKYTGSKDDINPKKTTV